MKHILLLGAAAMTLSGCAAVGLGAGAGFVGVSAAKEGGLNTAAKDAQIQARINQLWFEKDIEIFRKLDLTVSQGRVLVTGIVQNPDHRVEAIRLAWQPKDVKQVINEIRVDDGDGISGFARDAWISTSLRTKITVNKDIQGIHYTIDTVDRSVYLMGVARNQNELDRVMELAFSIKGVKEVVSYVKFAGQENSDVVYNNAAEFQADIAPDAGGNTTQSDTYRNANRAVIRSSRSTSGYAGVEQVEQPIQLIE